MCAKPSLDDINLWNSFVQFGSVLAYPVHCDIQITLAGCPTDQKMKPTLQAPLIVNESQTGRPAVFE